MQSGDCNIPRTIRQGHERLTPHNRPAAHYGECGKAIILYTKPQFVLKNIEIIQNTQLAIQNAHCAFWHQMLDN